jgi:hypothetical protein
LNSAYEQEFAEEGLLEGVLHTDAPRVGLLISMHRASSAVRIEASIPTLSTHRRA